MLLIASPRFEEHVTPPGHPERMERAHVFNAVARRWAKSGGRCGTPRAATREELARVHGPAYLDALAASAGQASMLDPDTYTSPESVEIAALAAGATVEAAMHAYTSRDAASALVRPPGHHAERDRAMGFCLYNNVAVAAAAARAAGCERVAIVDIDVHHGNGTQWMFYDDAAVLYVSSHQFPFYPGTGAPDESGRGAGRGYTVNVPLEAGARDEDVHYAYAAVVMPVLEQFGPRLTLISAGFDTHELDPLASLRMSSEGCVQLVGALADIGRRFGGVALVTEGGYHLGALEECLDGSLLAMQSEHRPLPAIPVPPPRGARAVEAVRAVHREFWKL